MSSKAIELSLSLSASLRKRGFAAVDAFDTNGLPVINVGTMSIGSQSVFIRTQPIASIGTDSLGLTQRSFGPHVIQCVVETSTIANVALLTEINKLPIMAEVMVRGTRVELYMSANGNAPDVADITSGNLKATWDGQNADFGVMAAV